MKFKCAAIFVIAGVLFLIGLLGIVSCTDIYTDESSNVDSYTYECDYRTISLNTKITTVLDGEEIVISGKILRLITDPLTMYDSKGNVLGETTDTYNFINQDDHAIIVDNKVEAVIAGNFEVLGESYKIYNSDKQIIGSLEVGALGLDGCIKDVDNNLIAVYDRGLLFNDYSVTFYDNDILSDKAILLMFASYKSDAMADSNSSSSSSN